MGYFLVYENMLKTVLIARDRWLKPGGILLPDKAVMYVCGIEDGKYKENKIHWWESVYGFNMSVIRDLALKEPIVDVVESSAVKTTVAAGWSLDMNTIKIEDLDFEFKFQLQALCDDYLHALVVYFDIEFSACHKPVRFSTGPFSDYTHWKQTVFYLKDVLMITKGDVIDFKMHVCPNEKNNRDMNISLDYDFNGRYGHLRSSLDYILR